MAMTPQERADYEQLKTLVGQLMRVEHLPFIENLNRRLSVDAETSTKGATSENVSINEAGSATKTALGAPDGFISVGGRNVPYYN